MKIKSGLILRSVGGENVVVPIGEMSKKFHGMITLNETGAFLWKFFAENHTQEEAVAALLAEYDVSEEIAQKDVAKFVEAISQGFAE